MVKPNEETTLRRGKAARIPFLRDRTRIIELIDTARTFPRNEYSKNGHVRGFTLSRPTSGVFDGKISIYRVNRCNATLWIILDCLIIGEKRGTWKISETMMTLVDAVD